MEKVWLKKKESRSPLASPKYKITHKMCNVMLNRIMLKNCYEVICTVPSSKSTPLKRAAGCSFRGYYIFSARRFFCFEIMSREKIHISNIKTLI